MIDRLHPARRARADTAQFSSSAAAVADLAAVVLGAGGTVPDVVDVVVRFGPTNVGPIFESVAARVEAGELLAESLRVELSELGPAFHPLSGALVMADKGGAPVGSILQHLSEDARQARNAESERRARALSVQLLVPLVLTLLPAVILGAVVPILLVALANVDAAP